IIPSLSMPTPITNAADITPASTTNLLAELSAAYTQSVSGMSPAGVQSDEILVNSRIEIDEEYLEKHHAPEDIKAAFSAKMVRRQSQEDHQYGHLWKWCRVQCET